MNAIQYMVEIHHPTIGWYWDLNPITGDFRVFGTAAGADRYIAQQVESGNGTRAQYRHSPVGQNAFGFFGLLDDVSEESLDE
ncbi:MAG: hypothetical protein ISN29_00010 [Gammaproteobacteria bacterium AqS3]|nr:hypothetical protein [Gammaproteobacteria bacterium AqS3]